MSTAAVPVIGAHGDCFGRIARLGEFAGIRLTETHYTSETIVPNHRHDFPGFFMPLRGKFEFVCGPNRTELGAGRACYHSPSDVHSFRVLSRSASALDVEVRGEREEGFAAWCEQVTSRGSRIPAILAQLRRELRVQDSGSALAVEGLILQATAELKREKCTISSEPPLSLKRAVQFLTENIGERIDLKQLAAVAGIGPRDLLRGFKRFFDGTPAEFVRGRRIAVARQRLAETEEPIALLANEIGFYDQAHFSHEFKKATGCSPREYRELVGLRESDLRYDRLAVHEVLEAH
jgi:AraC family transcriptional regulator